MLKNERLVPESFTLYFTAPADSLPKIKGLNFNDSCLVAEPTLHNDTITYWVTDTMFTYHQDTLAMTITYLETDTLGMLSPHTDTLEMAPKTTYEKLKKEKDKKIEDWEKEREKKLKKAKEPLPYEENPFLKTFLEITGKPAGSLDPNQNVVFTSNEPIASLDTTMMHFYLKKDSNLIPQPFLFLPVEGSLRSYTLYAEWETKQQYVFQVDSAAFLSILGNGSKAIKQEFRVRDEDEFGSIFVHITSKDSNVVVQIMSKGDKPMRTLRADEKGRAAFYYMKPGDYYIRCFIDNNQNDKWDTGNYQEGKQPEEVFYFPKPLTVKAKWDLAQDWNPRLERLDKQKAMEITKQKPDKEKTVKDRNRKRDEEMRKAKSGRSKNSNNRSSNSTNSNRNSFR